MMLKDGIVEGVVVVFALEHSRRTMSYGDPGSQCYQHIGGGCNRGRSLGYASEASTTLASSDSNILPRARDERVPMYVPIKGLGPTILKRFLKHMDVYIMYNVSIKFTFGDVFVCGFFFPKIFTKGRGARRIIYYTLVDYKNVCLKDEKDIFVQAATFIRSY